MSKDLTRVPDYLEELFAFRRLQNRFESFIDRWEKPIKDAALSRLRMHPEDGVCSPCGRCRLEIGALTDNLLYFEWRCSDGYDCYTGAHGMEFTVEVEWLIGYLQPLPPVR